MSTGYYAAVGDPRYNRFEVQADPTEGDPSDRTLTREGPGLVDRSDELWPSAQSTRYDAAEITGYAHAPNAPYDAPDAPGAAPDFQSLDYFGESGQVLHTLPPMPGLPTSQGAGFQQQGRQSAGQMMPEQVDACGWRPKLSAFLNLSPIGPLQQRRNPGVSSIAVPDADLLAGFPLPNEPRIKPHLGLVTRWPAAQMLFKPMGSGGDA